MKYKSLYVSKVDGVDNDSDGGPSMENRRVTRSMTKRLQLGLEDQVLTIMNTWKPPSIGASLACNLLCIELDNWWGLHAYDSAIRGPCKILGFWLILNGLHAMCFGHVWLAMYLFYFFVSWIWDLVFVVGFGSAMHAWLVFLRLNQSEACLLGTKPWKQSELEN